LKHDPEPGGGNAFDSPKEEKGGKGSARPANPRGTLLLGKNWENTGRRKKGSELYDEERKGVPQGLIVDQQKKKSPAVRTKKKKGRGMSPIECGEENLSGGCRGHIGERH